MTPEHLAKEAERLTNDAVLVEALERVRARALEKLATIDATDTAAILREQAIVEAVSQFCSELAAMIIAGGGADDGRIRVV